MNQSYKPQPHKPRAFRLNDPNVSFDEPAPVQIEPQPDAFAPKLDPAEQAVELALENIAPRRFTWSWGGLFWTALSGLGSLAFGLWIENLVEALFAKTAGLGWLGVALAALVAISIFALLVREYAAIRQQRHVAKLHEAFATAHAADDMKQSRALVADLATLYVSRPETAAQRSELAALSKEIIDGRDLINIAEMKLIAPLDAQVQREIANAAKRVSLVTAIAPRAFIDVIFVAAQAVRLIRRISEIYGGRPGFFGFFKLAKSVGTHLAITGGMAVGDSLLQQVVGHGIAARVSAKLGEGVLNGLLTTRVGVSAMSVCRPMPFAAKPAPGVKQVAPFLFSSEK